MWVDYLKARHMFVHSQMLAEFPDMVKKREMKEIFQTGIFVEQTEQLINGQLGRLTMPCLRLTLFSAKQISQKLSRPMRSSVPHLSVSCR